MALSTATCDILKICKPLLEENRDAIGATFYRKLFSEHPGLRNTFNMSHQRPGEAQQQLALGNALVAYCANCDQLDKLGPFVERVANKHLSFNVQPEQVGTYIQYITCMISTIPAPVPGGGRGAARHPGGGPGQGDLQRGCEGRSGRGLLLPGGHLHQVTGYLPISTNIYGVCAQQGGGDAEECGEQAWRLERLAETEAHG